MFTLYSTVFNLHQFFWVSLSGLSDLSCLSAWLWLSPSWSVRKQAPWGKGDEDVAALFMEGGCSNPQVKVAWSLGRLVREEDDQRLHVHFFSFEELTQLNFTLVWELAAFSFN